MDQRCLILSYYFPPTGAGGVQRISKLLKYATREGWQFTVVTSENSASNIPDDKSLLSDIPESTKVIRIPSHHNSKQLFIKNNRIGLKSTYWKRWLSAFRYLPDPFKHWLPQAKEAILSEWSKGGYDCVLVSVPPYSLAILAAHLFQDEGIPVILDMRDPWTENPYKLYPTPFHLRKDRQIENEAIAQVPYGISAYAGLIDFYKKTIPTFNAENWMTIANGYDEQDFTNIQSVKPQTEGLNIAFSGTFYSHINNPVPFFRAMAMLKNTDPDAGSLIHFHHFGKSNIDLNKLIKRYNLKKQVKQAGYLEHSQLQNHLSGMDALLFILDEREPRSSNTIGGKVYEYLRLKKPILALVPKQGEAANLIRSTQSGQIVASENTQEIAEVLKAWSKTSPKYSYQNIEVFSRQNQAKQFIEMFQRVVKYSGMK